MRSRAFVCALLALLLSVCVAPGAAAMSTAAPPDGGPPAVGTGSVQDATPATATPSPAPTSAASPPRSTVANVSLPDGKHVLIRINLTADGDANWTVSSYFVLDDENDTRAFRAVADAVESGQRDVGYDLATFQQLARLAENETGREMTVEGGTWRSRVDNDTGVLSFSFTWTNFAPSSGDQVRLGDVFRTDGGTWFPALTAEERLVINAPPDYAVVSATRAPLNGTVSWNGPYRFAPGEIRAVYRFSPTVTTSTTTITTTSSTDTTTPPGQGQSPFDSVLLGAGAVFVLVVGVAAGSYLLARRRDDGSPGSGPPGAIGGTSTDAGGGGGTSANGAADGGTESAPDADSPTTSDPETPPTPDPGGETAPPASGTGGTTAEADAEAEDADIDEALLSDEERVERLLERNGGRMKQANIVTETGWSNAKVSQLLSSMADEDRVDKLRIGRENLITLPDEEVGEID